MKIYSSTVRMIATMVSIWVSQAEVQVEEKQPVPEPSNVLDAVTATKPNAMMKPNAQERRSMLRADEVRAMMHRGLDDGADGTDTGGSDGTDNGADNGSTNPSGCFSIHNKVDVRGKGMIDIDTLKIGDYVLTGPIDQYSRVYSFSHWNTDMEADFVQIYTNLHDTNPLELTADHMLFANGKTVRANDVKVGDTLLMNDIDTVSVSKVHSIKRGGVYAPLTESGTIVVNGVVTSNYVAMVQNTNISPYVQHMLGHAMFAPYRLLCNVQFTICMNESYVDGRPMYAGTLINMMKQFNLQNPIIQIGTTLLATPVLVMTNMFESILLSPTSIVVIAAIAMTLIKKFYHSNNKVKTL